MKKTAFIIMIITILSKILGFGRELTLSYFYGASRISDAFIISITIPNVIFGFVSASLVAGYIPILSKIEQDDVGFQGNDFTNNLINILLFFCTIIIVLVLTYTEQVVKSFASGFEGEVLVVATNFTRISILAIYFNVSIAIFGGYLQVKNNYVIPAFISLPLNLVIILSIVLSLNNYMILSVGFLLAAVTQMLFMLPALRKKDFKYKMKMDFRNKHIISMMHLAIPVILGTSINEINVLVDRTIASRITIGGVSALNYANRLNSFVLSIFVLSLVTVMYPLMSRMVAQNNLLGLKKTLSETMNLISLFVVPTMFGTMLFAREVVILLFERGAFDSQAVYLTSSALFFYSIGMLGFGLREVLSRVFYSLNDTRTPMLNAAIGLLVNIVLNVILSRYLGLGGLALATSISALFTSLLLLISLRKKIGPLGIRQISISFLKILFASIIMGSLAKMSFEYLTTILSRNISLFLAICIGVLLYFLIIIFLKIQDVDVIVETIKKKFIVISK